MGSDPKSKFLYMRTKGKVEIDIKNADLPNITVYRPSALLNRDNDFRIGEAFLKWIPFLPKIESKDCAKAILAHAIESL